MPTYGVEVRNYGRAVIDGAGFDPASQDPHAWLLPLEVCAMSASGGGENRTRVRRFLVREWQRGSLVQLSTPELRASERYGRGHRQTLTTKTPATTEILLTDSNRRPPPYHGDRKSVV